MKRPGEMRQRIALLRATEAQNAFGEAVPTWNTLVQVWAGLDWTSGTEAVSGDREYSEVPVTVWVRMSSDTRSLREKDRALVPLAYTTLKEVLATTDDTSVVVNDAGVFPPENEFAVRIGSELLLISSKSGNTLTATRGAFATTAARHNPGVTVIQMAPLDIVSVARHGGFLELTGVRAEVRTTA